MKNILAILLSFFALGQASAASSVAYEYVSIDCPAGDITLRLEETGKFLLELKHWDPKLNRHTFSETISGKWRLSGKQLLLSGNSSISYKREFIAMTIGHHSASIDSFVWEHSSVHTFADKYSLAERRAVDELLRKATLP